MEKKLSVIVPIYNSENYLKKCIQSILEQGYKDIEVILINDGSTDSSEKICYEFENKDPRVRLINKKNEGVSSTRNVGIEKAKGKYIAFVDSDDAIEDNMYVEMLRDIEENCMPIIGYKYIDENDKILDEKFPYDQEGIFNKNNFYIFFEKYALNSPVNKIFNLDIIKKNNIRFEEDLSLGEDLIFVLEYIKYIDKFKVINKTYYRYLVSNNTSLSKKYRPDLLKIQTRIIEKLYEALEQDQNVFECYKNDFYTRSLDFIMQVINNTMSEQNNISLKEKFNYNDKIIKSDRFKELVNLCNLSQINVFTKIGFKIGSYKFIYYSNKFIDLIKRRKK